MIRTILAVTAVLLPLAASAQEPVIPDEATKIRALKRAYELNGNSMVRAPGQGSIDLSKEDLSADTDPMGPVVAQETAPKKECKLRRGKCRE